MNLLAAAGIAGAIAIGALGVPQAGTPPESTATAATGGERENPFPEGPLACETDRYGNPLDICWPI